MLLRLKSNLRQKKKTFLYVFKRQTCLFFPLKFYLLLYFSFLCIAGLLQCCTPPNIFKIVKDDFSEFSFTFIYEFKTVKSIMVVIGLILNTTNRSNHRKWHTGIDQ